MHAAAVITLVVVLTDRLPVGSDLIADRVADDELGERIALDAGRDSSKLRGERPRLRGRQMDEDEPAPGFDAYRVEMDGALVESRHGAQVRCRDEIPIEVVRPLMIGT